MPDYETILDRSEIEKILPHTGIMLLLDSISISKESSVAIGKKTILKDDVFMQDHHWAYPGVLLEECANQAAALYALVKFSDLKGQPGIAGNDGKKIGTRALPGDELTIIVTLRKKKMGLFFFDAVIVNQEDINVLTVNNIKGVSM